MPEFNYMSALNETSIYEQYNDYLSRHIENVQKGYEWAKEYLPEIFVNLDMWDMDQQIALHDKSKYSEEEYGAYAKYFYGEKTPEVERAFEYAWLSHQKANPHHPQFWVLIKDKDDMRPLEMPYNYILEMIFDHWSFSWKQRNLSEIFNWYEKNRKNMNIHPNSQKTYEHILSLIKNKLKEVGGS